MSIQDELHAVSMHIEKLTKQALKGVKLTYSDRVMFMFLMNKRRKLMQGKRG